MAEAAITTLVIIHRAAINPGAYVFGNTQVSASFVGLSNPFLTWEESQQIDVGLDAEFFNNRLSLIVDLYNKESKTCCSMMSSPPLRVSTRRLLTKEMCEIETFRFHSEEPRSKAR